MDPINSIFFRAAPTIAASLAIFGTLLIILSLRYKTANHPPIGSMNPKNWQPLWKMKRFYSPKGWRYFTIGWPLFMLGALIQSVYYLLS